MTGETLIPIGPIVRVQVQINPLKVGAKPHERYDPGNIRQVTALEIGPQGVIGLDPDRDHALGDVHNREHPRSRFRGENGVSIGFTSHYRAMRDRFGGHLTEGIAGENILVACDEPVPLNDIANGLVIGEGDDAVIIDEWVIARPCAPFTRFSLGLPHEQKSDRRVTEGLQFLDDGTRGFYGRYHETRPSPALIRPGAIVYRRR
jgi:hypothetical protein